MALSSMPVFYCADKADKAAGNDADPCANATGNGDEIIAGPAGPAGGDYDQVFRSLEVDPTNPQVIYLGTERNGIVQSEDGGHSWRRLRLGMRHIDAGYPELWDLDVCPRNPQLLLAATHDSPGPVAGDYPSSAAGVYRSQDGGASWSRANCGLTNSCTVSIRFAADDPMVAVLGIGGGLATFSALQGQPFAGALLWSGDGGLSWNPSSTPSAADENGFWILRSFGQNTTCFITFGLVLDDPANNLGFLRSSDEGHSWTAFAAALKKQRITEFDVDADGTLIYAMERDAFSLRRSKNGGATWDTLAAPANGPVRISPADSDRIIFCENEKVYLSVDGMKSWHSVLTALDRVDDVEFSVSAPDNLYLATRGYHLYKSTNSGATWAHLVDLRTDDILK